MGCTCSQFYFFIFLSCLFCIYSFISLWLRCRIQVNRSHLLLRAVSDTSIYTVSLASCRCDDYLLNERADKEREPQSSLKTMASCELTAAFGRGHVFPQIAAGTETWPTLLATFVFKALSCLPVIWQARNNRSHTESFESPIGLCLEFSHPSSPLSL